ncbi:MAG: SGNH/GDSL hydrolase family protein [Lapillicoccus sp.]
MTFRRWMTAGLTAAVAVALTAAAASGAPAARERQVYVAMGDSYSSGPLIPPQTDPVTCIRSGNNYAGIVARALNVQVFHDVTCSGATTRNFRLPQDSNTAGGPPAPPQYSVLTDATTIVTVGIGGNDIGLIGLALGCINVALPPVGHSCQRANGTVYEQKIDAFAATYGQVIDRIRARAPHAQILMVGYPTAIQRGGCFPTEPLIGRDATYLQATIDRLNLRMREQSHAHGATYIDLRTSTIGHDSCQPTGIKWLEGVVPTSPAYPLHPNALGMANAATQVLQVLRP